MSNFSFSHSVFYPFRELTAIFIKFKIVVCKLFHFDETGGKLSKYVENIVGKGEIARYEQFFLFQQCFQKACFPVGGGGGQKVSFCGNGLKIIRSGRSIFLKMNCKKLA